MKTIIYIKVIIYGSQAPFRVNITECFKTFMNQACHHHREVLSLCCRRERQSEMKKATQHHPALEEGAGWRCTAAQYLCVQYLYTRQAIQTQPMKLLISKY